jgi:predicted dehydrogenase
MTAPVRVGVIGLGAIGARLLKEFAQNPETTVTALCDTNAELAAKIAAEQGGIPWSTDYRAMLEGDQVDLVYVAVPPRFHHRIVLDAFAAGKHVLCEKPLSLTLAEAEEMTAAAQASGLVHALNLPCAFAPGVRAFAEKHQEGYIGELRRVDLTMVFPQWPRPWQQNPWIGGREQGGPIREVGPHMLQIILRAFGPVRRVLAHVQYPPHDDFTCEQSAAGILELQGGQQVVVSALCNLNRPDQVSLTAYGTAGTLGLVEWTKPVGARTAGALEPIPHEQFQPVRISNELVRAIRGEKEALLVGFEEGLAIQRVLDGWERSIASGGWVEIG